MPIVKPDFYDAFPTWFATIFHSGISSAAVMAVLLNLLFNELKLGTPKKDGSAFAAAPPRMVIADQVPRIVKAEEIRGLLEGDRFKSGKIIDADGEEIPVVNEDEFKGIVQEHRKKCEEAGIPCPDESEFVRSGTPPQLH